MGKITLKRNLKEVRYVIIEIMICDICNEEIPKVKKKDWMGIEREYYRKGKINVDHTFQNVDLSDKLGIHICERCAAQISMDLMKSKMELLLQQERKQNIE